VLLEQHLSPIQILGAVMVVAAVASVQRWGIPEAEVPYEATR
jgi:threonine/homoserine efflux transporter RhtA